MFKKFWLETIYAFFFILLLAFIINQVIAFKVFDVFDPIGEVFADMESTDIVFSQLREDPMGEEDLVLVNIGDLDRAGIAEMVNIINAANPKVIGMDMLFRNPKEDTLGDLKLADAFSRVENLVMYSKLVNLDDDDDFDTLEVSYPPLFDYGETAFVNFITGAADQDDLKMCREFAVREKVNGQEQLAFAVKIAQYMAPEKVERFLERGNDVETINYRGSIFDYGATQSPIAYFALDWYQVLGMEFAPDLIEGKAVIFCFLGSELGDRKTNDDVYFTPLNKNYVGKTHADMFGGVVHANVFSMIMSEDYINAWGENYAYILALIILYLNIVLFTVIYKVVPKWYDGLTKLIQLIEAAAIFTLSLVIFIYFNLKVDVTWTIFAVLIAGDALEVFFGVFVNLFTKEGRNELRELKKL
ncbi:CHASE2 domain-containing protein [Reichenbachiella carrageenanivorans]|uniref:CHASE2 domain-containing protein n=1 Tax=Reichenbachiella carrageenanivorans TaxID=2979869 RepID=A0ABY6CZ57_9BACT|nr:CHASE2 domain-containing protein [Reichenbachiella carrageenanivorans]UXX78078.1 CHASE2 domain-containing protein [Reichenbachiella carrageenanivorans]